MGKINDFAVFGANYQTPDGTAVRDYIHVLDLADAHVAACNHLLNGGQTNVLNLGVGSGHSVLEIIQAVEAEMKVKVPYRLEARRPGDPAVLIADPSKTRRILGFEAKHSCLKNIIKTAVGWHKLDWRPTSLEEHGVHAK